MKEDRGGKVKKRGKSTKRIVTNGRGMQIMMTINMNEIIMKANMEMMRDTEGHNFKF